MSNQMYVQTKEQLKAALEDKADEIIVTNEELAKNIKKLKSVNKFVVSMAIAGMRGVTVFNIRNPLGTLASACAVGVSALGGGATVIAIITILGLSGIAAYAVYKDYDIVELNGGSVKLRLQKKASES